MGVKGSGIERSLTANRDTKVSWVCLQMYELKYFVYIPEKLEDAKKDLEELNRQKQDAVWS